MIRIGDSKTNLREGAEDAFFLLAEHKFVGPTRIALLLIKTYGVPKVCNDPKHTTARLSILKELAIKHGVGDDKVPMHKTIEYAVRNFENSNKEVRQAAQDLVIEYFKIVGLNEVMPLLEGKSQ